jgi:hypothetical protein
MLSAIHDAETATIKTLSAAFLADLEGDGEHWDEGEGHRSMETVLRIVSVLMVMLAAAAAGPPNPAMIKEDALRRSVGQMIIVGFNGISNTDPHFRRIIEDLESGIIGGVLFLARNVQSQIDLETMVRDVQLCNCVLRLAAKMLFFRAKCARACWQPGATRPRARRPGRAAATAAALPARRSRAPSPTGRSRVTWRIKALMLLCCPPTDSELV